MKGMNETALKFEQGPIRPAFALKSFGAFAPPFIPVAKLQGILAKANKSRDLTSCFDKIDDLRPNGSIFRIEMQYL